jgi:hypothetical protein
MSGCGGRLSGAWKSCGVRMRRDRPLDRLYQYYQHTASVASAHLARQTLPGRAPSAVTATMPVLPDYPQALAWVRAERANLISCLDLVTASDLHLHVVAFTSCLAELLRIDGPWAEAVNRHIAAANAAESICAEALNEIGTIDRVHGELDKARASHSQALGLARESDNSMQEAMALTGIGRCDLAAHRIAAARGNLSRARTIFERIGTPEAMALAAELDVIQQSPAGTEAPSE